MKKVQNELKRKAEVVFTVNEGESLYTAAVRYKRSLTEDKILLNQIAKELRKDPEILKHIEDVLIEKVYQEVKKDMKDKIMNL